ncbi:MAG TPA: TetR/AcrR family transcriptional regulator [Candidatus Angelobacter sp.]
MFSTNLHLCPEISVHDRISSAGKHLFFLLGFDNASVQAICREAKASELQFQEHFESKEALLSGIFEEAWSSLLSPENLQAPNSPQKQLKNLARAITALFRHDRELRDLLLLEGRRVRSGEMMMFTPSYTDVIALMDSLLQSAMRESGSDSDVHLLRSCLTGAFEGLLRDLTLQERFGYPVSYSPEKAEQFAAELIDRLFPAA